MIHKKLKAPGSQLPAMKILLLLICLFIYQTPVMSEKATSIAARNEAVLESSRLSRLARSLHSDDPDKQKDFALISLNQMLASYIDALEHAKQADYNSSKKRLKLARWQRATARLTKELETKIQLIEEGDDFTLFVDRKDQVIILIQGNPILITGPDGRDAEIEKIVLELYCNTWDCSALEIREEEVEQETTPAAGAWSFADMKRPAYIAMDKVRCQYNDFTDKKTKAALCEQLALELQQFESALAQARRKYSIDWESIITHPPKAGLDQYFVINPNGHYIRIQSPLLTKLHKSDWQRSILWLRKYQQNMADMLLIAYADQLHNK